MLGSKEIAQIINFNPTNNGKGDEEIFLGQVEGGWELRYGLCSYPMRSIAETGEPRLLGRWTRQPQLSLDLRGADGQLLARQVFAYPIDVRSAGEEVAKEVLDRIHSYNARQRTHELGSFVPGG